MDLFYTPGWAVMVASLVRSVVVTLIGVLIVVCLVDWLARTRRINPFNPIARFLRQSVDPLMAPMERRIVRAGGLPSAAPLWTLAAAVVLGIIIVSATDFVLGQLIGAIAMASSGAGGLFILLVKITFGVLQIALLVRVISSWLPISPYSGWVRWSFALTEPILRPLRQVIPTMGMFDVTPIVAYFVLRVLEWAFLSFRL